MKTLEILRVNLIITLFFSHAISFAAPLEPDTVSHSFEFRKNDKNLNGLINPLLDCYDLEQSTLREMKIMESNIENQINLAKKSNQAVEVSVYYRDLKNGHWVGFGVDNKYSPASLLKLPILIAALKQAEDNQFFLDQQVRVEKLGNRMLQNLGNNNFSLEIGKSYTIEQLLEYMIIYSDNHSKDLVINNIGEEYLKSVFNDLGIDAGKYTDNDNFLSVKDYATYYRLLFNCTYLSKEMSVKALEILTRSRFKLGIMAGIPDGILVAHKFGERVNPNTSIKQLHDTGIVYKPNRPYLLCIMVKGMEFQNMEKVIANISKTVYNFK